MNDQVGKQEPQAVVKVARKSVVGLMAERFDMGAENFMAVVKQTVFPEKGATATDAQVLAFLAVAHEHGLNPFTREIFAFPTKTGGIQPIVSIDGWVKLIVSHPQFNGMNITFEFDDKKKPLACTCEIYRKDREHTTPITEYYDECYRNTDPWNKMPRRMLRHKAIKEAGRVTFGFAGITDEDEGMDAIRNITGESTEISRETNAKTEALKEKIGAKKNAKEKAAAAETAPVAETPLATPVQEPPQGIEQVQQQTTESTPPPADDEFALEDGERTITEAERQKIISTLMARAGEDGGKQAKAKSAARGKFLELGYQNSKDIRFKHFGPLLQWAGELTL